MGRINRVVLPGIPHHVTARGVRSMNIFESDIDRKYYLSLLKEYSEKYGLEIVSWCLMTNHVHLIVIPTWVDSLSRTIRETHKNYARTFNKKSDVKGALFQSKFYSTPMSQHHLHVAVRYVLRNPVRAKIVSDPLDYEWSSAAFHAGKKMYDPLVSNTQILDMIDDWEEYLIEACGDLDEIRKKTKTGRPLGDIKK